MSMKLDVRKFIYKCNSCGKEAGPRFTVPDNWKELPYEIHFCDKCANAREHSERIELDKAVVGDKFLTRAGREATLINILQFRKRPYVFADDTHVWSTLWNGFVDDIDPDDIVKKID